jgi:predicted nuclease of predicted toxin-antitoxin system
VKIVIDMNLGVTWIEPLEAAGHEAAHWSAIGQKDDPDEVIMEWARTNDHIVLTADLGIAGRLFQASGRSPSVIQLRHEVTLAAVMASPVIAAIDACSDALSRGAVLTVERAGFRLRELPGATPLA